MGQSYKYMSQFGDLSIIFLLKYWDIHDVFDNQKCLVLVIKCILFCPSILFTLNAQTIQFESM